MVSKTNLHNSPTDDGLYELLLGLKSTVYLRKSARLKFEIDCSLTFGETFSYANMTAVGHVCEIILKLCGLKFCYKTVWFWK